jgi:hypothetical protein
MAHKDTPLWGSISRDRGRFTLHYARHGSSSDVRLEGYDLSVFEDCPDDLPIIRFDKAEIDHIVTWLRQNYSCSEHSVCSDRHGWTSLELQDYLGMLANYSIGYEELRITRADADLK